MKASTKKGLLIFTSLLVIGGIAGYLIYRRRKDGTSASTLVDQVAAASTPTSSAGSSSYVPKASTTTTSGVPTTKAEILKFQKFANDKGWKPALTVDGVWGSKSAAAWATYGDAFQGKTAPAAPPTNAGGWNNKDKVYLKTEQTTFFSYPKIQSDYIIGKVTRKMFGDTAIGVYVEPGPSGWAKIIVGGYEKYDKTTGQFGGFITDAKTIYVTTNNIQKNPY